MRKKLISLILPILLAMVVFCPASADQDDNDNNADLQDTPEEICHAAVLKRWPDATDVDVLDLAEDFDDEDANRPAEAGRDIDAPDTPRERLLELADKVAGDNAADDDMDDDAQNDFTLSVTFQLNGLEYEALLNDKGVIRYVYEEVPVADAPVTIMKAARDAVKDGDFLYVDKVRNETKFPYVSSYIVGVGEKDVYLDADAKVQKIEDAPADDGDPKEKPAEDAPADGML
jgi:hypothetical protein